MSFLYKNPTSGTEFGFSGALFTGGIMFLFYLLIAGVITWSSQMMWLAIIGVGIWWLTR